MCAAALAITLLATVLRCEGTGLPRRGPTELGAGHGSRERRGASLPASAADAAIRREMNRHQYIFIVGFPRSGAIWDCHNLGCVVDGRTSVACPHMSTRPQGPR